MESPLNRLKTVILKRYALASNPSEAWHICGLVCMEPHTVRFGKFHIKSLQSLSNDPLATGRFALKPLLLKLTVNPMNPMASRALLQRGRDSNPRYTFGAYTLSRRAPSTTRPPLYTCLQAVQETKKILFKEI